MKKTKKPSCENIVCELRQLELPLEPFKRDLPKPSNFPQLPRFSYSTTMAKATQTVIHADDRISMTAFHFTTMMGLFAQKVIEAYKNGLEDNDVIKEFGLLYGQDIFKYNLIVQSKKR